MESFQNLDQNIDPNGANQPKSFMTPVFGRTFDKREAYSVGLRKKKRDEILSHKRAKI